MFELPVLYRGVIRRDRPSSLGNHAVGLACSKALRPHRLTYAPEETRIDSPDEEEIRYALEIIGRGNEFDRIRQEAMRELF